MIKGPHLYFTDRKAYWKKRAKAEKFFKEGGVVKEALKLWREDPGFSEQSHAPGIKLPEDFVVGSPEAIADDQAAMGIGWPTAEDGVTMGEVAAETLPTESLEDLIKQTDRETLDLLAQWTAVEAGEPTPTRTAQSLLLEAAEIVSGDRARTHGPKERSFELIAKFWDLYLVNRSLGGLSVAISAIDVAQMMVLLKVARSVQGEPTWDHYLDAAGYSAVAGEIFAAQKGRK